MLRSRFRVRYVSLMTGPSRPRSSEHRVSSSLPSAEPAATRPSARSSSPLDPAGRCRSRPGPRRPAIVAACGARRSCLPPARARSQRACPLVFRFLHQCRAGAEGPSVECPFHGAAALRRRADVEIDPTACILSGCSLHAGIANRPVLADRPTRDRCERRISARDRPGLLRNALGRSELSDIASNESITCRSGILSHCFSAPCAPATEACRLNAA